MISNDDCDFITQLAIDTIPDYVPPVTIHIRGKYATGDEPTRASRKAPTPPTITFTLEVKS